jgi:hypothetical protein
MVLTLIVVIAISLLAVVSNDLFGIDLGLIKWMIPGIAGGIGGAFIVSQKKKADKEKSDE